MAAKPAKAQEDVTDLQEALECPVCLLLPQETPIYQCDNGHIICKTCHARLTNCPQCRKPLGESRNLFAEKFLVKLMKACPFEKHGCLVKLMPEKSEDHLMQCDYREIICFFPYCNQLVSVRLMKNHLQIRHKQTTNTSTTPGRYSGKLKILEAGPELGLRNSTSKARSSS